MIRRRFKLGWDAQRASTKPAQPRYARVRTPRRRNGRYTKYRGVTFDKQRGCRVARICRDGKTTKLESFDRARDAAEVYRVAIIRGIV